MNNFIDICKFLDENNLYDISDKLLIKISSSKKNILNKRILIPSEVQKNAEKAYKKRFGSLRFGDSKSYEIARKLHQRNYMDLDDILEIHKYTVKNRYKKSNSDKQASYWEYLLYGGIEGRDWASDIIKIYLPEKWKTN